ncbi:MAG: hypothetical protein EU530_07240 [Promethearchaeota archaeon]|nr:MAG: hypothetical protein EU530_07240 [Candidatus Lokiarchaeota archaeon]
MTKSYQDYYTRVNFNFNSIPTYHVSEIEDLEQLFISDLIIEFVFFEDQNKTIRKSTLESYIIRKVDVIDFIDRIIDVVQDLYKLKIGESLKKVDLFNQIGFKKESIWTFLKLEGDFLDIAIKFEDFEPLSIRTKFSRFCSSVVDFANVCLELIKQLDIPSEFLEFLSFKIYSLIAYMPFC